MKLKPAGCLYSLSKVGFFLLANKTVNAIDKTEIKPVYFSFNRIYCLLSHCILSRFPFKAAAKLI